MATSSASAGYLAPSAPAPLYGDALEDLFHGVVQGITGISAQLIRPRWQPEPANMPAFDVNWVALGVTVGPAQWDAFQKHDPTINPPNGANVVEGTEELILTLSFYGPDAHANERLFRDGLRIEQNRDELTAAGIKLIEVQDPVTVPALFKNQWVMRADVRIRTVRWVRRVYPILSLSSASGGLDNEHYVTPLTINP